MNETIVLYGAGELGKLASEFFDFYKIDYIVCDDNPENYKDNPYWENFIIVKPEDIAKSYQILVCISTASYNMIRDKLTEKGFTNIKPFFQYAEQIQKENGYKHPLTNGWQKNNFSNKEFKYMNNIVNSFGDWKSFIHYQMFFKWHKDYIEFIVNDPIWNNNLNYGANLINCNDRYFIPEVTSVLHDHETFIDVGAYDGRVGKQFIDVVEGKYNEIFMFEPQTDQYLNLINDPIWNNNLNYYRTFIYEDALSNTRKKYIGFNNNQGYLSKINKKSKQKSLTCKLDSFKYIIPTFIKIHVEGYELEVLKGSIKTIKKYRPILTVTTYHTEEGLYKIPLWLIKNCKDYNFYWRNHNYQGQGAVMYCVPKERYK